MKSFLEYIKAARRHSRADCELMRKELKESSNASVVSTQKHTLLVPKFHFPNFQIKMRLESRPLAQLSLIKQKLATV
jgi:hypothetical protein